MLIVSEFVEKKGDIKFDYVTINNYRIKILLNLFYFTTFLKARYIFYFYCSFRVYKIAIFFFIAFNIQYIRYFLIKYCLTNILDYETLF